MASKNNSGVRRRKTKPLNKLSKREKDMISLAESHPNDMDLGRTLRSYISKNLKPFNK